MIIIKKSTTLSASAPDASKVCRRELLESSRQHIGDVGKALAFFSSKLTEAAITHDYDKLTEIDWFYSDFNAGFKETSWWDNHRKIHRHHLAHADGVPSDVNLMDVLEYIADCVMAGMARRGGVYELVVSDQLLRSAFKNTVELLTSRVLVEED